MQVGEKKFMKKQLKKPQLKIYFEDMLLLDRIANIADALSVSMSAVGELLVKNGIANLEAMTDKHLRRYDGNTKKKSK
jgi:hypothetical protein